MVSQAFRKGVRDSSWSDRGLSVKAKSMVIIFHAAMINRAVSNSPTRIHLHSAALVQHLQGGSRCRNACHMRRTRAALFDSLPAGHVDDLKVDSDYFVTRVVGITSGHGRFNLKMRVYRAVGIQ